MIRTAFCADYRSCGHLKTQKGLQGRIPKNGKYYTDDEEILITDWVNWSIEYGLVLEYDYEEIIKMLTPHQKLKYTLPYFNHFYSTNDLRLSTLKIAYRISPENQF